MTFLYFLSLLGVSVFAISGVLTAIQKEYDLIGILVIATVAGLGGGTIRDLLLGVHPITWIRDVNNLIVILITVSLSCLILSFFKLKQSSRPSWTLLIADAVGLALFTISGTQIAQEQGVHWLVAILMGSITGSAGGVLRDILSHETPLLFRQTELYATTSIVGAASYLMIENVSSQNAAVLSGALITILLRIVALKFRFKLPIIRLRR